MSEFVKYMHVERVNHLETEGLLDGVCYVFYKIDGTNASVWYDGEALHCGSRNRELSLDNDNAGFMNWAVKNEKFYRLFMDYPKIRLYGEWLVPHSLKTYRDDAWRDFYVFDVLDENGEHVPYEDYKIIMDEYGINYIPPLAIIKNPNEETLIKCLEKTGQFLLKEGEKTGEGFVVKNYDFVNRFGRVVWGKMVTNEFKEKHHKEMGAPEINNTLLVEERIVDEFITPALIQKEKAKIENEHGGWSSKNIPQLLGTMYYVFIQEELWTALKKHKNPKINFKLLNGMIVRKVKQELGL